MTTEEAIKFINEKMIWFKPVTPREYEENDALRLALEALEKQMPKKPIYEDDRFYCSSCYHFEGHEDWNCKVLFDQEYCDCCGQRLDWSEKQ